MLFIRVGNVGESGYGRWRTSEFCHHNKSHSIYSSLEGICALVIPFCLHNILQLHSN